MMNNNTHASRAGMGDTLATVLLVSFAPLTLLLMVLFAGFCA